MSSISAEAVANQSPPWNQITLSWDGPEPVTILRRDPDRSRPVRGAEPVNNGGLFLIVNDYEAPFGVPVVYEAVGSESRSTAVSASVTLNPENWYPNDQGFFTNRGAVWLRHLTKVGLSMPIDLFNAESPVFKQTRSVLDVLDRRTPIVIADGRRKQLTSTLDIRVWSLEEGDRLKALLEDNSVLLLTVPAAERWGITQWYVTVGDVTEERLWQEWAPFEGRVFHLPVEIVERPSGGRVYSTCTYWSEQQRHASYLELAESYPSYAEMSICLTGQSQEPGGNGPIVGCEYFSMPNQYLPAGGSPTTTYVTFWESGDSDPAYRSPANTLSRRKANMPAYFALHPQTVPDSTSGEEPYVLNSLTYPVWRGATYLMVDSACTVVVDQDPSPQVFAGVSEGGVANPYDAQMLFGASDPDTNQTYDGAQVAGVVFNDSNSSLYLPTEDDTAAFYWYLGQINSGTPFNLHPIPGFNQLARVTVTEDWEMDTASTQSDWIGSWFTGCLYPNVIYRPRLSWTFKDVGDMTIHCRVILTPGSGSEVINPLADGTIVYATDSTQSPVTIAVPPGWASIATPGDDFTPTFTVPDTGTYSVYVRFFADEAFQDGKGQATRPDGGPYASLFSLDIAVVT